MNSTTITKTINDLEELYKATMQMYQSYFQALESRIKNTDINNVTQLAELNRLAEEANEALVHDMDYFQKVVDKDTESINKSAEDLKILELRKSLQNG